jgi:hypothetical protein
LGEDRAPTADPDAESPRRLLVRLAARRSPDKLVRLRVGVTLRLLARLSVRRSSGVTCWLRLKFERLLMALGERMSETTRLSDLPSSAPPTGLLTDLATDAEPSLFADERRLCSRMAFGVSVRLKCFPAGSIGVMLVASARLRLWVADSSGIAWRALLGLIKPAEGDNGPSAGASAGVSIPREWK